MIYVWGKLKPGVTVEQARTEMKGIAARLEKTYPDTNGGETAVVTPLLDNLVGKYRTNLGLLLGAVGLVLLIACANLANLFAARGAARAREFAIHAAVGATRGQIIKKAFDRKFCDRASRRSARIFVCGLGPQRIDRAESGRRFPISTSFLRSARSGFHVFDRIGDHGAFRIMAGLAGFAR